MNEPDFTSRLIDVMNRGQAKPFELRYEGSDNPIWLYVTLARLKKGLTITLQDVTPLKQYQLELQTKIEELNRSNNSLQQFNYIASHDLQEPLRKVQQFGDLLENEYGPSLGPGIDYLKRMQSAANRMSTLIKDLLSFSRISTWQKKTASISLTEVVREALLDLELLVEETRAVVDIGPLPTVEGDAMQLGQLFQNLLANALKFHQENVAPVIRINSQLVALKDVPASVRPVQQAPQYHRIDVADNGIGFDEKYLDRIFQVFQRLHSKSEFAGTGIGLAICEQVAANHGGAITAISQPGQGATFSIYLPAQTAR